MRRYVLMTWYLVKHRENFTFLHALGILAFIICTWSGHRFFGCPVYIPFINMFVI